MLDKNIMENYVKFVNNFIEKSIDFFENFGDNLIMEGLTIEEMAKKLGITEDAVYQRIHTLGIKPLTRQAVYPESTLEAIREVSQGGRPRKAPKGEK
jgi:hypothetical protein